jgi:hypothetical protein
MGPSAVSPPPPPCNKDSAPIGNLLHFRQAVRGRPSYRVYYYYLQLRH